MEDPTIHADIAPGCRDAGAIQMVRRSSRMPCMQPAWWTMSVELQTRGRLTRLHQLRSALDIWSSPRTEGPSQCAFTSHAFTSAIRTSRRVLRPSTHDQLWCQRCFGEIARYTVVRFRKCTFAGGWFGCLPRPTLSKHTCVQQMSPIVPTIVASLQLGSEHKATPSALNYVVARYLNQD